MGNKPPPSIGVVIPTHQRPKLLDAALESVLCQEYEGKLRVVVVFDRDTPNLGLIREGTRPVSVLVNDRTPGPSGARNTGILAMNDVDLVAFCDDDDRWMPGKLSAQVAALAERSDAEFVTTAIEAEYAAGKVHPRVIGIGAVELSDLLRSRMAVLHSSTFVLRRDALINEDRIGLFAEDVPGSNNEDFDLLLRAARRQPILHVDRPLVRVLWGNTSFFTHQYRIKIASLEWMLNRHPDLTLYSSGAARRYGQLACWYAALGQRRDARRWVVRAIRRRWSEPRIVIALAVMARLVSMDFVLSILQKWGRGL
ncbi:MAG: glycosyltransferase family 2 protein [Candidatus Micrarchaeaceae archaeon]